MSEILDSYAFSSYLITAKVGQMFVYKPKINKCCMDCSNEFILINSTNVNEWHKALLTFLFSTFETEPSIEDQSNECTYVFSQVDVKLSIKKQGFQSVTFTFAKFEVADLVVGLSHMYIQSLALALPFQIAYTFFINYFEQYDSPKKYTETFKLMKEFSKESTIKLFTDICNDHKLQIAPETLFCSFQKYQYDFCVVYKMRMCKKVLLSK